MPEWRSLPRGIRCRSSWTTWKSIPVRRSNLQQQISKPIRVTLVVQPQNRWYQSPRFRTVKRVLILYMVLIFSWSPTRRWHLLSPNTYGGRRFLSVLRGKSLVSALPKSTSGENSKRSRAWRTFGLGLGCVTTFISKPSDRLALYGRYNRTAAPIPDVGYRRGSPVSADGSASVAVDLGKRRQNGYPRRRVAQLTLRPVARCAPAAGRSVSGRIGVRRHEHEPPSTTFPTVALYGKCTLHPPDSPSSPSPPLPFKCTTSRGSGRHHQSVAVVGRPQTLRCPTLQQSTARDRLRWRVNQWSRSFDSHGRHPPPPFVYQSILSQ